MYPPSQVLIWNLDVGEPVKMIDCHSDVILCMSFNTDGSLLTTTCKDKKLRVIEPRSGRVLQVKPRIFLEGKERYWDPGLCFQPALEGRAVPAPLSRAPGLHLWGPPHLFWALLRSEEPCLVLEVEGPQ